MAQWPPPPYASVCTIQKKKIFKDVQTTAFRKFYLTDDGDFIINTTMVSGDQKRIYFYQRYSPTSHCAMPARTNIKDTASMVIFS